MGSRDTKGGGRRAPSSLKIKQEPDARVHLGLPGATRNSHVPSEDSKSFYRPPKLPFRPPTIEEGEIVEPPAQTISWPDASPFPRALHLRDPSSDLLSRGSANLEPIGHNRHERDTTADGHGPTRQVSFGIRGHSAMPPPSAPRRTRRVVAMGFNAYSAPLSEPKLPAKPAQLKPVSQPSARYQRGGTSNMTQPTMTPMQHLSQECQRRGFNPAWVIKEVRGNAITCAVKLRDMTIHGDETYRCSMTAKYAVAMKALPIVRNWPISSSEVGQQYRRYHAERTVVNEERRALARVAPKIEQGTVMADVPAVDGRGAIATRIASRDHNLDSAAEQAEVLDQVRRMARGALPGHALGNGESARIFLEGLVAGVRAARLFEPGARARSRSPASGSRSSASYRERSTPTRPPSGYRNLDAPPAGDPPLQSMDLYPRGRRDPNLPNSDRYRPDYASIAPRYASNGPSEKEWAHDKFRP